MKKLIKKLLRESLLQEDEDILHDLYDILFEMQNEVISEYIKAVLKEKPNEDNPLKARQPWRVVPFSTLKRQWEEYMKYGFVKPNYEKTILEIQKIFTENVFKVRVNTELAGHSQVDPKSEYRDFLNGTQYDNENLEKLIDYLDYWFGEYITEHRGQYRISDYGLPKLEALILELHKTHDINKKLPILDRILNVIHMRSDIAEWFVEGGSSALSELSGEIK
jgi:hypothetical protein